MPGIARKTLDSAGGIIINTPNQSVYVNGQLAAVKGSGIAPHGSGLHASAELLEASSSVYAEGIQICRSGDLADCTHATSGSGDVFAG